MSQPQASFKLLHRAGKNFAVLELDGYVNEKAGADVMKKGREYLEAGFLQLIIKISPNTLVNSLGLMSLIWLHRRADQAGGMLHFCGMSPVVSKTLNIAGLLHQNNTYQDVEQAQQAIAGM